MAGRSRASSSRAGTATRHNAPVQSAEELIPGFRAETELERRVTQDPELLRGLAWGKPRKGHPEGTIANHVQDLLERLARRGVSGEERELLRFLVLGHDSFKNKVQEWRPRTGENHHAMRARRFAERYTDDERLLSTIELHDRPYSIWRKWGRTGRLDQGALKTLLQRIVDPELFIRFVEQDGSTEGKNPEPVRWFKDEL